ncbi:hypothetical protein [Lysinibacillus phage vB_LspM-01]|nr:hypothetical protein [Lysinibacillus phage vB_LspM-01]
MRYNKLYNFSSLIDKYSVPIRYELPIEGSRTDNTEYDDLGNLINPPAPITGTGMASVTRPSDKEIYQSGGRITVANRILRVKDSSGIPYLPPKTKIFKDGQTYFVEGNVLHSDYADFKRYNLTEVDVFD